MGGPRGFGEVDFHGWRAFRLEQGPLRLHVVPAVGGRLMSVAWDGVELCFIHPDLRGRTWSGTVDGPAARAEWAGLSGHWTFPLWGGDKTWIAPESDWPGGAPHRDLDSGAWAMTEHWFDATAMGLELRSPVCRVTALQLARRLTLHANDSRWHVEHRVTNRGARNRRCGLWDVQMLRRPARVVVALPGDAPWGASVHAIAGRPPIETLVELGRLVQAGPHAAEVDCDTPLAFKCGFDSLDGVLVATLALPEGRFRYERRADVAAGAQCAHGHPLEVFNAPRLPYFEIEAHSACVDLAPGQTLSHGFDDRVTPHG